MKLLTNRLILRRLTASDVNESYRRWFEDPVVRRFIVFARTEPTIETLRSFVEARANRSDVLFLGIFLRETERLIGTLKFEPISDLERSAFCGIMIGDPDCRGRGVAQEALVSSIWALYCTRGIETIHMGVDPLNEAAKRVYSRCGFRKSMEALANEPGAETWTLAIQQLILPTEYTKIA